MILPNVRASFGRTEAGIVLGLLSQGDAAARAREEARLGEEGFDALLDDPRTLNAIMAARSSAAVPAPLVFYLLVRHALLECAIRERRLADYLAAVLIEFGRGDRAGRFEEHAERLDYLVDVVAAIEAAQGRERFLLQTHLGNAALWLSGLFPDYLSHREQRRGAPGLGYYEQMGQAGFRMASLNADAARYGIDDVLAVCAEQFPALRISLNHLSDRFLFPQRAESIDRMLRRIADELRLDERRS